MAAAAAVVVPPASRLCLTCPPLLLILFLISSAIPLSAAFQLQLPTLHSTKRHETPSRKALTAAMMQKESAPLTQSSYRANVNPKSQIQSLDVATLPRPGTSSPSSVKFHVTSKRGEDVWVTYLLPSDPASLTRQLYATHSATGRTIELFQPTGGGGTEDDYSPEEKLRRERARMMATGVTCYSWAAGKGAKNMLVPFGGALWLLEDPLGNAAGEEGKAKSKPRKVVETNSGDADPNDFHALPTNAPLLDAKISSDGSTIAFIAGNEVYTVPTTSGGTAASWPPKPRRVTAGARDVDGKTNGVADYLAQEELERPDGFWLSPRGTRVAFEEVDESHVPPYRIVHQGEDRGLAPTLAAGRSQEEVEEGATVTFEETRYPYAGARNPIVKFGVAAANGGEGSDAIWFDLTKVFGHDFYLAKVEWLPAPGDDDGDADSTKLVVQLLDRRQTNLALLLLDCATKEITTLHVEKAAERSWVNLNGAFRPLPMPDGQDSADSASSFRFLWASERDGYRHLYVLESNLADGGSANADGAKEIKRLTGPGEYICEDVLGIDADNGYVYYMGTAPDRWLERHLFRASLGDSPSEEEPVCLTGSVPGQHSCTLDVEAGLFVDTVSSTTQAPVVTVCEIPRLAGGGQSDAIKETYQLHDAAADDPRVAAYGDALKPPTFHTFPSTDGKVTLQAAAYLPDEETHGKGPWPLVVATYGGPHVQYVQETWGMMTVDMRSQFLRANGFAVIKVDNRGSNRRGLVFETPIYESMGDIEVADQVAGVRWAVDQGIADEKRVAISGWSYGGYMALKCLTDRPDVFHAAISGAPVTDWALYDTAYTERYMGLPQENPEGYAKSSALAKVSDIEGSLLLCHGLLDENVLFRQSAVLVNALIEHQKAYDLALFPSERHGPRRQQDRAFLEERILAFLQRSLGV
mmetsp:Transcript_22680/g.65331  ORF Transcript_22680/g.65331 Transcript_22680/m.65331 type:complete len:922 (+) Transcript_22680:3-2768(+)